MPLTLFLLISLATAPGSRLSVFAISRPLYFFLINIAISFLSLLENRKNFFCFHTIHYTSDAIQNGNSGYSKIFLTLNIIKMKTIIFFFSFISLTFLVKASVPDSVYYTQDKDHFLIKTTILKEDYSTYETDSSRTIVESYRNIIFKEKLSKLPEKFWEEPDTYLNYLIKSKVGTHISAFGATFLNGYFLMKENLYIFDDNQERFIEKTKHSVDAYEFGFLLSFLLIFLIMSSGAFVYQEIKFIFLLKNIYVSTADEVAKFILTGLFLSGIVLLIGCYFTFRKELYFWVNLPNILIILFFLTPIFLRRLYLNKKLKEQEQAEDKKLLTA